MANVHITIESRADRVIYETQAEQVLAATKAFDYWSVWEKSADGEDQTVVFIPSDIVARVTLKGKPEDDEDENTPSLKLINLDDHRA